MNYSPQVLMKVHKKGNNDGKYDTRLVVLVVCFTSKFSKHDYKFIKNVLYEILICYNLLNITQAVHLKERLE